ncbi:tetratricopeptide repeat protein [Hymenobacter sp. CRA2]|uniref:tetratricopeptide repeat protein n=1 Tax=Hymenobacter sp. CRA2 TaxID=1955620 RepID=UPI00098FA294|nr:tetratricopeptide repeat protein [Hymenobacter sp. CRA2]OON70072.1 hypothetical protein B0919_04835 [Hymenobacter sp. CRA2]
MRPVALLTGALVALSLTATAQTAGTLEAELKSGRDFVAANNFENAAWRLETVRQRWPDNAEARLLLGQCYVELGKYADARTELAKAAALNPALQERANQYLALASTREQSASQAQAKAQTEKDAIRARAAAALQARATADAAAKNAVGGPAATAPIAAAQLVYGAYVCTYTLVDPASKRMTFVPKGAIQLNANGTYRYLDGGPLGRYTYNAVTRQLTWISGFFAERGQPKTTFSPGDKEAQLDIELPTATGTQRWLCGCNKAQPVTPKPATTTQP